MSSQQLLHTPACAQAGLGSLQRRNPSPEHLNSQVLRAPRPYPRPSERSCAWVLSGEVPHVIGAPQVPGCLLLLFILGSQQKACS